MRTLHWISVATAAALLLLGGNGAAAAAIRPHHHTVRPSAEHAKRAQQQLLPVRLALKQRNVAELEKTLLDRASPSSAAYGQWLCAEQIGQMVGVSEQEMGELASWLSTDLGVSESFLHASRDYIDVTLPAALAAEIVGDAQHRQRHPEQQLRSGLQGRFGAHPTAQRLVDFAFFTQAAHGAQAQLSVSQSAHRSEFAHWKRLPTRRERMQRLQAAPLQSQPKQPFDDNAGTPANQRAAYGIPASVVGTAKANLQQIWGPGTYGFQNSDLSSYYSLMSIPASELSLLNVTDYPGVPGGDNFGEGSLDVSLISGLAPGVETLVTNTDTSQSAEEGAGFGPAFLTYLTGLQANHSSGQRPLPLVISLSLGSLSWDSCDLLCRGVASKGNFTYAQCADYMQQQRQVCMYPDSQGIDRMHVELAKLTAQGVTILAATGDGGSHFSFQQFEWDDMGNALNDIACNTNTPTFPAESPYVIGVGGSTWRGSGGSAHPQAWGASGGGFSWRFPRPAYQDWALGNYTRIASRLPPAAAYNASNRAYPDVAALADNVPIVLQGQEQPLTGTSCSAPSFAAVVSLLNDARLNAGLPSLGFLHPVLYALSSRPEVYPTLFTDMTLGDSECDSSGACCTNNAGFVAAKGWDPTTGLGRPKFAGLLKMLKNNDFLHMFQ